MVISLLDQQGYCSSLHWLNRRIRKILVDQGIWVSPIRGTIFIVLKNDNPSIQDRGEKTFLGRQELAGITCFSRSMAVNSVFAASYSASRCGL